MSSAGEEIASALAEHPGGAADKIEHRAADERDRDIGDDPELPAAHRQPDRHSGRQDDQADQQYARQGRRPQAKVTDRPDPRELPAAQRLDQVAEVFARGLPARVEVAVTPEKARQDDPHRQRQHGCRDGQQANIPRHSPQPRSARAPDPHDDNAEEHRHDPSGRAGAERDYQGSRRNSHRQQSTGILGPLDDHTCHERGAEHQQECGRQLLDPPPQAVAVQQRRLGAEERHQRAQTGGLDERFRERVYTERDSRAATGQVGLEYPGRVDARQPVTDSEQHEPAERIRVRHVGRKQQGVRGRGQIRKRAPMRHHVIGDP